jgi:hypothetical protein
MSDIWVEEGMLVESAPATPAEHAIVEENAYYA